MGIKLKYTIVHSYHRAASAAFLAKIVLVAICELSVLSIIFSSLSILLPLGRMPAFVWLIAVGFTLPNHRQNINERDPEISPRRRLPVESDAPVERPPELKHLFE